MSIEDVQVAPFWLVANGILACAAWRVAGRLFGPAMLFERLMHVIILCWAWIVLAAFALGGTGFLSGKTFLALVGGTAALALVCLTRSLSPSPNVPEVPEVAHETAPRAFPTDRIERRWLWLWGAVLSFWLGNVVVGGLLEFPTDWDSLMYHIPIVDQWLRAGGLYAPDCEVWHNASNNELLALWCVAPFSGDFLVGLANLSGASLLALGTMQTAGALGLRPVSAHLAAFVAVSNFVVLRQVIDSENDVAAAGAFMAALAYSLRYARGGRGADLALASVAVGLLAGVKYYALGYAAVAWATLVLAACLARGPRAAALAALAGLAGVSLLAGYWYARNAWLTGLPLYPRAVFGGNDPLGKIRPTGVWSSTLLGNGQPEILPLLIETIRKSMGAAHLAACAVAPVAAAWLCLSSLRRKRAEHRARLLVALALLAATANWSVIPFCVETTPGTMDMIKGRYLPARFGLCVLSLAVMAFVVLLDDVQRWLNHCLPQAPSGDVAHAIRSWPTDPTNQLGKLELPRWATWRSALMAFLRTSVCHALHLTFTALAISQLAPAVLRAPTAFRRFPGDRLDALLVAVNIALAALVIATDAGIRRRWLRPVVWTPVCIVTGSLAIGWLGDRWHRGYAPFYDTYFHTDLIGQLSDKPAADTRICACTYRYYPFLGSRRQFRVSRPLWVPTYESLLDYMRVHDAAFVLTTNKDPFSNGRFVHTKEWLDVDPGRFELVRQDATLSLYRVLPNVEGDGEQAAARHLDDGVTSR